MDGRMGRLQHLVLRLYDGLLRLYPPRFRREFSAEIREVFWSCMHETAERPGYGWLAAAFREILGLSLSILRECWHELRARKEKAMAPEDPLPKEAGGMRALRPSGTPGALWFTGWALLTTAAIPVSMLAAPVLAVGLAWLANLGVKAGWWPAVRAFTMEGPGFLISLSLTQSLVQGYLLRRYLPRVGQWLLATGAGILLGGLIAGAVLIGFDTQNWDGLLILVVVLLPVGLALGMAQWLCLRRFLPDAFWIIPIDVLAAGSILVAGRTYTSLAELTVFVLPGVISGLGLWLLLGRTQPGTPAPLKVEAHLKDRQRLPRLVRVGLVLAGLVPLFFGCSWVYAVSQLSLAKNAGVYPTVEQAILANNGQGFGGAKVVRIEDIRAQPNNPDALPHVWFGGATVHLDRVPAGHTRDHYQTGSFYLHVKDGWVHVGEGAFPEFIGWVMELYHLEGVGR